MIQKQYITVTHLAHALFSLDNLQQELDMKLEVNKLTAPLQ
jgi:hypothetical protein